MIWIKHEDQEFNLKWHHQPQLKTTLISFSDTKEVRTPIRGMTTCTVTEVAGEEYIGRAYCSIKDQYSKKVGRKVSLQNAITGLPKEVRTAIWQVYLNRHN